ncbi:immunoglobulin superfamily member 2-like [Chiloscyllium plagiosum]|uniref:immunoglobulin superfamily member 2-like n=1 Tax=Chiloscyllium plagiosum TaxID=36176 RepID=UPI001CB7E0A5|nr:immunoglobulin superfamily member 2-like [Chiloscyllium plagiosum]
MEIFIIFILCIWLPGAFSPSVTQTPTVVTRSECQSLSITCVYYGHNWGYLFQDGFLLKETQDGSERRRIFSGGRFVVRMVKEEKTFSLEIQDIRIEDAGTYYCQAHYLCWKYDTVDGPGTVVTVTADSSSLVSHSPPSQTSTAGETVTLSCEYSGSCHYTVYWYSQATGQALKHLLQRHTSGEENQNAVSGEKLSASINSATKIVQLKISKMQMGDSAVYYCALSRRLARTVKQRTGRAVQNLNTVA